MGEVGKVAIEVELLTGDLDKEIAKIEKELKDLDNESKGVIKSNGVVITGLSKLSDEQIRHYNKLVDRLSELNAKKQELINKEREETNIIKSQTVEHQKEDLHTQTQLAKINLLTARLEQMVADYRLMNRADIVSDQDVADAKVLKKDILETVRLLEKMTGKKYNIPGITDSKRSLDGIAQATENVIKKVGRWALAVFGIRSAYMFIRQAMGVLSQYNEKIGADIQYIRFALASALQPVIEKIIELVYKLLAYIGYIAKAWFGVELFANASVKSFQRVNKSVKDTSKSAKELKKQLAGFDEMNILQDNGSVSSGGGGGGVALPSQDLSDLSNIEIPDWVKWIAEHGELIKNIIIGIGQAFLTWKLVKWASELGLFSKTIGDLGTMLQVVGIVAIVIGITNAIGDLIKLIADPSWNNFAILLEDLSVALLGVGAIALGMGASWAWIPLVVSGIGFLVSALIKDEESTLSVYEANKQLEQAQNNLSKATNSYTSALDKNNKMKKELADAEKKAKQTGKELYNQVILGIISFDDMSDTQKELYGKYLDSLQAEEDLRQKTLEMQQANDKVTAGEQKKAAAVYASTGKYTDYFNSLVKGFEDGKISSQKMENAVVNIMQNLDEDTRKTFAENLPQSIKNGFQQTLDEMGRTDLKLKDASSGITISYKEIASSTKTTFENDVPKSVDKSIKKVDSLTSSIDKLKKKGNVNISVKTTTTTASSGGSKNAKGAIYYPPKLAVGGIINQPGRGVPLAMGGERGAEGVIPLTDSQQMQKLGEAIGKYITVNANIVNTMNGRVISRELKQIENEETFAFNGG